MILALCLLDAVWRSVADRVIPPTLVVVPDGPFPPAWWKSDDDPPRWLLEAGVLPVSRFLRYWRRRRPITLSPLSEALRRLS